MRLLFVSTAHSYRNNDFIAAAKTQSYDYLLLCEGSIGHLDEQHIVADFAHVELLLARIAQLHDQQLFGAVMALDDSGAHIAAAIAEALHIPHNRFEAIEAARNKGRMRTVLFDAGVPVPWFHRFVGATPVADIVAQIEFPCVIKPLLLNGSRGVIRTNTPEEFLVARTELLAILDNIEGSDGEHAFLVEAYSPGIEVALEAILDNGQLYPLALFDKPDPLTGPLFEETIYVTPSRHSAAIQSAIIATARDAAAAIGLVNGPVHAELRFNDAGVWVVEVAGRSIGGLCSRTLRFGVRDSLEELILQQAMCVFREPSLQTNASGVMMIPIPHAGILQRVEGIADACLVPGIESVEITSPLHQAIQTLPAGESYLGFIFARGDTPAEVEDALRSAHSKLSITIMPHFLLT